MGGVGRPRSAQRQPPAGGGPAILCAMTALDTVPSTRPLPTTRATTFLGLPSLRPVPTVCQPVAPTAQGLAAPVRTLPAPPQRAPSVQGSVAPLLDRHGRTVRDLRLSVTDRCNLRCTYCMPAQGLDWLPTPELLTTAEIARLARLAVTRMGVERIRLTGGEPLMRRDLEEIVRALAPLRTTAGHPVDLGLTTNGLGLDRRAPALRAAGLRRVNVSIDTLDPDAYAALTRRNRLPDVLAGAAGAQAAGLCPVKVNAVAQPGLTHHAPDLLRECLRRGWQLRFIEHMPLGPRQTWSPGSVVTAEQILDVLRGAGFTLTPAGRPDRRPAALWHVAAGADHPAGSVGVIASVSQPFCADCDRTRVTADGRLMTCLFSPTETDLRSLLRGGASDEDLIGAWRQATWTKPLAHGSDTPARTPDGFERPGRTMSAIGG